MLSKKGFPRVFQWTKEAFNKQIVLVWKFEQLAVFENGFLAMRVKGKLNVKKNLKVKELSIMIVTVIMSILNVLYI